MQIIVIHSFQICASNSMDLQNSSTEKDRHQKDQGKTKSERTLDSIQLFLHMKKEGKISWIT